MEFFLFGLGLLIFALIFLAITLGVTGVALTLLKNTFEGVVGYFEQSFRYPLRLTAEKNILAWLYFIIVGYLFFLVLFIDMNLSGTSARLTGDVINLRRFSNSLLAVVIFLLNLPLIPLVGAKYPLRRNPRRWT